MPTESPPYLRSPLSVPWMMRQVLYALLPAALAWTWYFGIGLLINATVALGFALLTEAAALRLRGRPWRPAIGDYSAAVTAVLLAFCLPPLTPWWITAAGAVFAIGVGKHLFGGLGHNLFNPAMAGYAMLLVSFPEQLTNWLPPRMGDLDYQPLSALATLSYSLLGRLPDAADLDALTRATPLDLIKTGLREALTVDELRASPLFGDFGGRGWEWIGNYIALGGFWLLYQRIIRWQIPVAVLAGLLLPAGLFWLLDSAVHAGPGFHLFSGGALLCAFFIATDPVSAAMSDRGRLIYGAGIGLLIYVMRNWGSYPDGVAFAVLLMNAAVPLIDRLTRPSAYGHGQDAGHR
ncbi:MAG: RnfABCDGE type electron transport complex subunit D [Gammaproteobacteria bacterium]|nr:MAG: RnfABCDGE type electron transport complex subunit D [Gammaproteobacteria bacterium]